MSAEQEEFEDAVGFEVTDAIDPDDVGDLAEVKGNEAIEAVKDVTFIIVKASIETQFETKESTEWACKRLRLEVKVGPAGTDGEGKYAEKRFFPDMVVAYPMHTVDGRRVPDLSVLERIHDAAVDAGKKKDTKTGKDKPFPRDWWLKQAQLDFKEFALATGMASIHENEETRQKSWKMNSPLNDEMLAILASGDVEFIANVVKERDLFRGPDEWRNALKRFRAVPQGEAE